MRYRHISAIKRRLDAMVKSLYRREINSITIEHGALNTRYKGYDYFPEQGKLVVYDQCGDEKYTTVITDELLNYPKDYIGDTVYCSWDKKFPSILVIKEVFHRSWMGKV